jgi:hypothetical protein
MKTLKTFLAVLIIASISTTAFAKQGLLGKAKEAAGKKETVKSTKSIKKKGGKGSGDDMAVKGGGVPQNSSAKQAPATATPAASQTTK